jgi:hypothetical protein
MKLCKDCKYFKGSWFLGYNFARCMKKINNVTGKGDGFCSIERTPNPFDLPNYCGEEGKWFEPKKK